MQLPSDFPLERLREDITSEQLEYALQLWMLEKQTKVCRRGRVPPVHSQMTGEEGEGIVVPVGMAGETVDRSTRNGGGHGHAAKDEENENDDAQEQEVQKAREQQRQRQQLLLQQQTTLHLQQIAALRNQVNTQQSFAGQLPQSLAVSTDARNSSEDVEPLVQQQMELHRGFC